MLSINIAFHVCTPQREVELVPRPQENPESKPFILPPAKKTLGSVPVMTNNDTHGTEATQKHLGKERVVSQEQALGSAGAYFSFSIKINIRGVLFGYLILPAPLIDSLMHSFSRPRPNKGVSSASWSLSVAPSYSTQKNKPCKFVVW